MNGIKQAGIVCAVLVALVLGGQAAAQEFTAPVTNEFIESEIGVNAAQPIPYYYSWRLSARGGQLVLCGSGHYANSQLRTTVRGMMRNARIQMAGQVYEVDASFFTVVPRRNQIAGSTATCRVLPITIPRNPGTISFGPGSGSYRG
jgi:hypothetical protein